MNRIPLNLSDPSLTEQDRADIRRIEILSQIERNAYARQLAREIEQGKMPIKMLYQIERNAYEQRIARARVRK